MNLNKLSFGIGCADGRIYLGCKKLLDESDPEGGHISEWSDRPRKRDVTAAVGAALVDYAAFNGGGLLLSVNGVPKFELSVREIAPGEAEALMKNAASKERQKMKQTVTIPFKDLVRAPWILADVLMRDGLTKEALQAGTYITVYAGGCLTPQQAEGLQRKASGWLKGHKNVRTLMVCWSYWFKGRYDLYKEEGFEGLKALGESSDE